MSIMRGLFLALAAAALAAPSAAQTIGRFGNPDYATYQDPLLTLNSYGVPTAPLKGGARHLKIVPAYITSYSRLGSNSGGSSSSDSLDRAPTTGNTSWTENDAKGGGVVVSWLHGLSDRWGYSVALAVTRMSGDTFAFAEYNAGGALVKRHDAKETGTALQATALVIYDLFPNPDGFRLPLFAGYGFLYQSQSADYTARSTVLAGNPNIRFKSSFDAVIPGFVAGASAQINTGPLRWTPFIAVQFKNSNPSGESVVTNETAGTTLSRKNSSNSDAMLPAAGLGVVYKPWELGFTWAPNINGLLEPENLDHSIFTVSKTFKWGE